MNTRNSFSDTGIRFTNFSNVAQNSTKAFSNARRATSLLPPILGRSRSVSSNNFHQVPPGQQTPARRPVPVSPPKQAPTLRNQICMTLGAVDTGHGLTFNQLSEYISKVFEVARTVASDLRLKKTLCNMVSRGWLAQCTGLGPYDSTYKLASPPSQNTSGLMIHGRTVSQTDQVVRSQLPRGPYGATTQARPVAAAGQSRGPQKTVRLSGPTKGAHRKIAPCTYAPPPPVRSNSPSMGIDQEELPQEILNLQDDFSEDMNAGGDFERRRDVGQGLKDPYGLQSSYKPAPSVLKTDDAATLMALKPGLQQRISIFAVDDPTFSLGISDVQMPNSLVSPCPSGGRGSGSRRRTVIRMK